ncbi:subtilisin-like protein [Mycena olivaceomarginata]|nr:subtilisin-like protein [Mycena olivaceomarginata]
MALTQLLVALVAFAIGVHSAPPPAGWSLHRRADPDALIPLKFSLAQSNLDKLENFLLDIADPRSPNYGQHWSPARVKETFRPSQETIETVRGWLTQDAGIHADKIQLAPSGDILQLDVTIAEAESLLRAEYYVYSDDEDGSVRVGCHDGYTLPDHVSKHVDLVWPTVHFGGPRSISRRSESVSPSSRFGRESGASTIPIKNLAALAESGCDTSVTLDCLRELYNFDFTPVSGDVNTIGFGANVYRPSDLNLFFNSFRTDQVGHTPTLISVEGGDPTVSGSVGESSLDIELIMGLLGPGQNLSLYQVAQPKASLDPTDELTCGTRWLVLLGFPCITDCGNKPATNVISISYHFNPDLNDPSISPVVQRQCAEIGKLTLTGITIIASSGDGGVAYSQSHECLLPSGVLSAGNPNGSFVGQLPASWYVFILVSDISPSSRIPSLFQFPPFIAYHNFPLGLAPTKLRNQRPTSRLEEAFRTTSLGLRGRTQAVQNYLDNFVPDYACLGFQQVWTGVPRRFGQRAAAFVHSGGTSASAPIFASVIAAVNDARIAAGKSTVGFINPALYSDAFAGAFQRRTSW